jgi:hypothetical protein
MSRPKGRALEQRAVRKVEERQAEVARRSRAKGFIIGGIAVLAMGGIAAAIVLSPPPPGIEFPSLGNTHLSDPTESHPPYNSSPPSSGWHFGGLADWAESEEPVAPEIFIHNLEDAGIVLAYDCPEGCDHLLTGLRDVLADHTGKRVMLTPYSGITNPIDGKSYRGAAVAWTRVLYFDDLSAENRSEVDAFIGLYEGIDHHVTN